MAARLLAPKAKATQRALYDGPAVVSDDEDVRFAGAALIRIRMHDVS